MPRKASYQRHLVLMMRIICVNNWYASLIRICYLLRAITPFWNLPFRPDFKKIFTSPYYCPRNLSHVIYTSPDYLWVRIHSQGFTDHIFGLGSIVVFLGPIRSWWQICSSKYQSCHQHRCRRPRFLVLVCFAMTSLLLQNHKNDF